MNAASWAETISPGSLIAIFGKNLAAGQASASASAPLPLTLAGTSVTINGVPAPLSFVSPGQINAQVPLSLTAPDHQIILAVVLVTTPAGSAGIQTGLASGAPGLFTA
ncbi:MAG TPA: IPT/TIG domain-containing protein, partial [Bryobacteraceae bacterium]